MLQFLEDKFFELCLVDVHMWSKYMYIFLCVRRVSRDCKVLWHAIVVENERDKVKNTCTYKCTISA